MSNTMINKYKVVTYGTHYIQGTKDLEDSLKKYNWNYEIGGIGDTWVGFVAKLRFVSSNINKWKDQGFSHCIFVDAFDVLCTNTAEYVDKEYKKLGNPKMVLATEVGCWPNNNLRDLHPNCPYPWRFYHSQYILDLNYPEILKPELYTPTTDDQDHLMTLALNNKEIVADYEQAIFQTLAHLDDRQKWFELKEGKMYNKITSTTPCFWHGNARVDISMLKGL